MQAIWQHGGPLSNINTKLQGPWMETKLSELLSLCSHRFPWVLRFSTIYADQLISVWISVMDW